MWCTFQCLEVWAQEDMYVVSNLKNLSLVDRHILKCMIPKYIGWNFHCPGTMVCPSLQALLSHQRRSSHIYWSEHRINIEPGQESGHYVLLAQWFTHPEPGSGHTVPLHPTLWPSESGWASQVEWSQKGGLSGVNKEEYDWIGQLPG